MHADQVRARRVAAGRRRDDLEHPLRVAGDAVDAPVRRAEHRAVPLPGAAEGPAERREGRRAGVHAEDRVRLCFFRRLRNRTDFVLTLTFLSFFLTFF